MVIEIIELKKAIKNCHTGLASVWQGMALASPVSLHTSTLCNLRVCYIKAMTKFTRRWKGRSPEDVSKSMTALASRKAKRMTVDERKAHALKMVDARGSWVNGKFIKAIRAKSGKKAI